jgi:transposase
MIAPAAGARILLATKPVDFRQGAHSLAALAAEMLGADPFSGVALVLRSRRADRIRLLLWDGSGLVLIRKRLEGGAFRWPPIVDGVLRLTAVEVAALFDGIDRRRAQTLREIPAPSAPAWNRRAMRAADDDTPGVPEDAAALRALLLETRALVDTPVAERDALARRNERLPHLLLKLKRRQFGQKSERLPEEQPLSAFGEIEATRAENAAVAGKASPTLRDNRAKRRRAGRGRLPAHLPRVEVVLAPAATACSCCRGPLAEIGVGAAERLDVIPAQFRVVATRRPKLACRACPGTVVQAPAPARLVEGGVPTGATVAHVLVSRYADHLPLHRQAQILARQGIGIGREVLAGRTGAAASEVMPLVRRMREIPLGAARLFADETAMPALDPGRGRPRKGYAWASARDDRPWGGADPPAVVCHDAPGRGAERAKDLSGGYRGILPCDGYGARRTLAAAGGGITLASCRSHARRQFVGLAKGRPAPIAQEAPQRTAALCAIGAEVRGKPADIRRAVRQGRSRPPSQTCSPGSRDSLPARLAAARPRRPSATCWTIARARCGSSMTAASSSTPTPSSAPSARSASAATTPCSPPATTAGRGGRPWPRCWRPASPTASTRSATSATC